MVEFLVGAGLGAGVMYLFAVRLGRIERKVDLMPTRDEFIDQLDAISTKVDEGNADIATIKTQIEDLKGQIAGGGLTAEEEAEVQAKIEEAKVDK
jgi:predicted  nucleic acid-binding Zn-ribbon protein